MTRVFTIPSGIAFARALAQGVIERTQGDPLALADALVLVPTRRAVRTLRDAFVEAQAGAALGPRIRALGDVEEEELAFDASADDVELAPAIEPLRRRLLLATLVRRWHESRGEQLGFAQAVLHAGELGRFLDEVHTQRVDLSGLAALAPEAYAEHWQVVVKFLAIVASEWPQILAAEDAMEPAVRRDKMLRLLARRLAQNPPRGLVVAAGSTGSIPATAELLKTISELPNGAVVLPGLDVDLDQQSWDALDASHPQYGLRQLLSRLGIGREQVAPWAPLPGDHRERSTRVRFLSEALRPPPTTDAWRALADSDKDSFAHALEGVSLIEATTPREEALAIACALREALETPERTAALVTPDRGLARRVAAELARWDIAIDDSAGQPLARTVAGAFLALLVRAAAEQFSPVALLALLKHPSAAGGEPRANFRARVRKMEHVALRGLSPDPGLSGLAATLARKEAAPDLVKWFAALTHALQPLADAMAKRDATVATLARAHASAAENLAATAPGNGASNLWRGEAGEAAAKLLAEMGIDGADIRLGDGEGYAQLFRELAEGRAVRPRFGRHPRLAILGRLEARLQHYDLVVLGALNEGTWPMEASTDPWLSRPMRAKLGLEPPERRIGLAAHDFASLAAGPRVLLTRALKQEGAPTVPSRWLLRLKQFARGLDLEVKLAPEKPWLAWARAIDDRPPAKRAPRPAPTPPVAARPRKLSVTEIEIWNRDPYAIYAKHVLKLRPLDPIEMEPRPLERGNATHKALERFLGEFPSALPENALARLLAIGQEEFARAGATAAVLALWEPRFKRVARWFLDFEAARRKHTLRSAVEQTAQMALASPAGEFTLRGRADRIDLFADGTATIIDYKTGSLPSHKQVESLLSPQLPLEAAMLLKGKFPGVSANSVRELLYIKLSGGDPPAEERPVNVIPDAKAAEAEAKLRTRVVRFDVQTTPYLSRVMPFRADEIGDYDHLARVREWTVYGEEDE